MSVNYNERYKYRLREVLIKIKRVNQWIKDNPSKKNANMNEITGFLFEVGWILSDLKKHNIANNINDIPLDVRELMEEMEFMLNDRKDSINDFVDAFGLTDLWNNFVLNVFSGNINFYSTFENLKIKKLVCKELGVLKYICERRKEDFNYLYDNKLEFEYMRDLLEQSENCPEIGKVLFELIERYYDKESVKGHLNQKETKVYFDDVVFSSPEEELEFAEESTKKFSIWDCFINHKKSNATIFLDANNEFCLHPIRTHLFSIMKLYRALHNSDVDKGTDESALDFNNSQGNVIFRIVNGKTTKYFVPYFPTDINEFQLKKLKKYYQEFFDVYTYLVTNNILDDKHKDMYEECLEALEEYIKKFDNCDYKQHGM